MNQLIRWWKTGLPPWIKFVYICLLANGLPAFCILMSIPDKTADWFVWTIKPAASARLLGVMYLSALLLVLFGFAQTNWARARITLAVIAPFSVAATIVTFFHLTPFLEHPWFHLTYWLTMYLILFVAAPVVFFWQERKHGGRLYVEAPLSRLTQTVAILSILICGLTGLGLFIDPKIVNNFWPWGLTPLVGRILAVWFSTLAIAYAWALWDGDWLRTRLLFWQAIPCGLLLALLPLLHNADLGLNRGANPLLNDSAALIFYLALTLITAGLNLLVTLLQQSRLTTPLSNKPLQ
jgi:hypothetical protein